MSRSVISHRVLVLTIAAAAAAGIGLGALSAGSTGTAQAAGAVPAAATTQAPATTAPPVTAAPAGTPAPTSPLTADQASAIAVQASPGTVTEVEQDVEDTGAVFDVKVQHTDGTETKVEVDATSGQILSTETDGADDQPGDGH